MHEGNERKEGPPQWLERWEYFGLTKISLPDLRIFREYPPMALKCINED